MKRALVLTLLMGCSSVARDDAPRHVQRAQLKFEDPAEAERFDTAFACFAKRPGWQPRPIEVGGNFIRGSWCTWSGACWLPREMEKPGARWASVGTLHYPKEDADPIDVFGVQVSVGERHATGWSVSVSASSNGKRILGEHAFINFRQHENDDADVWIGLSYTWRIGEKEFFHRVQDDPWTWLARVRSSPAALRDETLAAWTALHDDVVAALEAGEVRTCIRGEYQNDGIPPPCVEMVPMKPEALAAEKERVGKRLDAVKAAMDDVETLHAKLVELAPLDCF